MEEHKEQSLLDVLEEIFTPDLFTIEIESGDNAFVIKTLDQQDCLYLSILPDYIYIDTLHKCGVTGETSLQKVDALAKLMPNIEKIILLDESNISKCGFNIDLAVIKILTKGESWYNSKGYISKNYKYEKIDNKKIIDSDYETFLESLRDDSLKTRGQKLFPDIKTSSSVREYFTKVFNVVNSDNCTDLNKVKWLVDVIGVINRLGVLKYDTSLTKVVNSVKGGKKTKYRKRSKKSRRTKRRNRSS